MHGTCMYVPVLVLFSGLQQVKWTMYHAAGAAGDQPEAALPIALRATWVLYSWTHVHNALMQGQPSVAEQGTEQHQYLTVDGTWVLMCTHRLRM